MVRTFTRIQYYLGSTKFSTDERENTGGHGHGHGQVSLALQLYCSTSTAVEVLQLYSSTLRPYSCIVWAGGQYARHLCLKTTPSTKFSTSTKSKIWPYMY